MKPLLAGLMLGAASGAPSVVGPETHISLGVAVSIGVSVCGMVWWLGRRLQQQDDLSAEHYRELTKRLDNLPCRPNGAKICPVCKNQNRKRKA